MKQEPRPARAENPRPSGRGEVNPRLAPGDATAVAAQLPPWPPASAHRDGHRMAVVFSDGHVGLRLVCPFDGAPADGPTPACRIEYTEDGVEVEGGPRLSYCNVRDWWENTGECEECLAFPDVTSEMEVVVWPVVWWWDGDTYLWTPVQTEES